MADHDAAIQAVAGVVKLVAVTPIRITPIRMRIVILTIVLICEGRFLTTIAMP